MSATQVFIITGITWAAFYGLFSGFLYLIMWTFSIEDLFSWKIALGTMLVWILIVRLFKIAGGRPI